MSTVTPRSLSVPRVHVPRHDICRLSRGNRVRQSKRIFGGLVPGPLPQAPDPRTV